MALHHDRQHFIPLRKEEIVGLLCNRPDLTREDGDAFQRLCRMLQATFHFEFHAKLEELKNNYAPFDPDAGTSWLRGISLEERQQRLDLLFKDFIWLMERANFRHLGREDYLDAIRESTKWGINMDVDFDVFERLEVFARGDIHEKRSYRRFWRPWRKVEIDLPAYERLALIVKLKKHKRLGPNPDTEHVFLKLFKNILKLDLEMLMPGAQVRMPGLTKGKLGASMLSSVGLLGYKIAADFGKLAWTGLMANPLGLWGPLSLAATYGYRQYYGFHQTKQSFNLRLMLNLYSQNLANNSGVLFRLLDEAEDQECREAFLAYYFLWRHQGGVGATQQTLDALVEDFLKQHAGLEIEFETGDAMEKLLRLKLVERAGDSFRAVPVQQALAQLDEAWDRFFSYSHQTDKSDA